MILNIIMEGDAFWLGSSKKKKSIYIYMYKLNQVLADQLHEFIVIKGWTLVKIINTFT